MRKPIIAIALLLVSLVATNVWWAYWVVDAGVSYTYLRASYEDSQRALSQALAIIEVVGDGSASRDQIVQAAQGAQLSWEPFEHDGYLWVGRLKLRFNESGYLIEAVAW